MATQLKLLRVDDYSLTTSYVPILETAWTAGERNSGGSPPGGDRDFVTFSGVVAASSALSALEGSILVERKVLDITEGEGSYQTVAEFSLPACVALGAVAVPHSRSFVRTIGVEYNGFNAGQQRVRVSAKRTSGSGSIVELHFRMEGPFTYPEWEGFGWEPYPVT